MTWSNPSSGVYKFTYTEDVAGGVTITYIDTYDSNYEITATEWSDTAGNSSSISWSTASKTFDYDGDKTTSETTQTVLIESGSTSWKFTEGGLLQPIREHLNIIIQLMAIGRTRVVLRKIRMGLKLTIKVIFKRLIKFAIWLLLRQLDSDDGIKYELFENASMLLRHTGWNGLDEVETTYYAAASGDVVGKSITTTDQWTVGRHRICSEYKL